MEKKDEEERQSKKKRKERVEGKEETKMLFLRCVEKCVCEAEECKAINFQQCSVCRNVLKSKCGKKSCRSDGEAPAMILVAVRKEKTEKPKRERKEWNEESEEDEEDEDFDESEPEERADSMWDTSSEGSFLGFDGEDDSHEGNDELMNTLMNARKVNRALTDSYYSSKAIVRKSILFYS